MLDVGCGYGRTLNEFYKLGFRNLTGIDYAIKMIERGVNLFPQIDFKLMSDNTLPFSDNSFDLVTLFAVLTCIIDNRDQDKIIQEIIRFLMPNGAVYISDYLLNDDKRNIDRYELCKNKYQNYGTFELEDKGVVRHHDKKRIEEIISKFDSIKYNETVYTTMNNNKSNGFYFIGKRMTKKK